MGKTKVSQVQLAQRHGVSEPTVNRWKRKGLLVLDSAGKILLAETNRELRSAGVGRYRTKANLPASTDRDTPVDPDDPSTWTRSEADRKKQIALALKQEMELRVRAGELVEVEPMVRAHADRWDRVRERLLAWPGRVAAQGAAELGVGPRKMSAWMTREIRILLEELARME